VSITDDDQRSMTAGQIVQEYQRGALDLQDTFVWREGMDDWVPLGQAPELMALMGGGGAAAAAGAYAPAALAGQPGGSTVLIDTPGPQAAARRAGGPAVDVFEAQAAAAEPAGRRGPPRKVGERNEASALFSLDAIRGDDAKAKKKQKPSRVADDELMALGTGTGGISASLEPPPLNAPAPVFVPPPPPKLPAAVEAQLLAAAQYTPPPKSKAPLVIALVAGLVLFGVLTLFFVLRTSPETATALNTPTTGAAPDTGGSDTSVSTATPSDTGPAATATTAPTDTSASTATKTDGSKVGPTTTGKGGETKKGDTKTEPKATAEPTAEPKATAEPAAGGPEFNRDAASAAMGGAAGAASGCGRPDGPTGRCKVSVTFAPSGRATNVSVGAPCGGSPVGSCIAAAFRKISIPPFSGDPMTVSKTVTIK
jgi:hypothetical protein